MSEVTQKAPKVPQVERERAKLASMLAEGLTGEAEPYDSDALDKRIKQVIATTAKR